MKIKFIKNLVIMAYTLLITTGCNNLTINANDNLQYQIIPYGVSHTLSNYEVKDLNNFEYSITLSHTEAYGKVHYQNSPSEKVTLYVKDDSKIVQSITISGDIKWKSTSTADKTYKVEVRTDGNTNLLWKVSLGKSDVAFS